VRCKTTPCSGSPDGNIGAGVHLKIARMLSDYSLYRACYGRYRGVLYQHFSTFLYHAPLYTFIFYYFLTFMVSIPIFSNNIVVFYSDIFQQLGRFISTFFNFFIPRLILGQPNYSSKSSSSPFR